MTAAIMAAVKSDEASVFRYKINKFMYIKVNICCITYFFQGRTCHDHGLRYPFAAWQIATKETATLTFQDGRESLWL